MLEVVVPIVDKVLVVDDLGADGTDAARDHHNRRGAGFQSGACGLDRKCAHAVYHHALALPGRQAGGGVADARHDLDAAALHAGSGEVARHAHAVIDGHDHTAAGNTHVGATGCGHVHNVAAVLLLGHVGDGGAQADPVTQTLRQLLQVRQDLCGGAVVAVGGADVLTQQLLDAVGTLGGVHLGGAVGVHAPDATGDVAPLQDCHRHARLRNFGGGVHAQQARADNHHVEGLWLRGWQQRPGRADHAALVEDRPALDEVADAHGRAVSVAGVKLQRESRAPGNTVTPVLVVHPGADGVYSRRGRRAHAHAHNGPVDPPFDMADDIAVLDVHQHRVYHHTLLPKAAQNGLHFRPVLLATAQHHPGGGVARDEFCGRRGVGVVQLPACQLGTLRHGRNLHPYDVLRDGERVGGASKAAVGAGHDAVGPHQGSNLDQPLRDQLRMLHTRVGALHHSRHDDLVT
mmetsp:Transcript_6399/g.16568  ORF Transcript_6399/g.16568 Transcript_6399/m.16568 type:complete len:460 (+) Transcript_6399:990-2369(+)